MKKNSGSSEYPFGQAPILIVDDLHIAQMDTILRYLGREHNLYGSSNVEKTVIDMILGGVEAIRSCYTDLIYKGELKEDPKKEYFAKHFGKESITQRNGGAHFQYLENFLQRNGGADKWVVGSSASIADLQLFDLVDLHLREALFPNEMKEMFPLLVQHHDFIAGQPGIAEYLKSDKRPQQINGVKLG